MLLIGREISFESRLIQSLFDFGHQVAILEDAAQGGSFFTPDTLPPGESLQQYVEQMRVSGKPTNCFFAVTLQVHQLFQRLGQGLPFDIMIGAD